MRGSLARRVKIPVAIQEQASLKRFNTFGVEARARWLLRVREAEALAELLSRPEWRDLPLLPLGDGSNVLFREDFDGVVVKFEAQRAAEHDEDADEHGTRVSCEAGRNWNQFVTWTLDHGFAGLENLALIPGTVGGAPVQNIGAYGVEIERCIESIQVWDRSINDLVTLSRDDCRFGYRTSRFKGAEALGRYVITKVNFRLDWQAPLVLDYPGVNDELVAMGVATPEPRAVAEAISRIRRRKLPDPQVLPNAGSFFKNPIVDPELANILKDRFPKLPVFRADGDMMKLSAAWLIEECGFKGFRDGAAGVYDKHALVLVNHGGASGAEIFAFAERINDKVEETFGFRLEPEILIL
jgi:UDP-N-acetylmuramate dehydrogenase